MRSRMWRLIGAGLLLLGTWLAGPAGPTRADPPRQTFPCATLTLPGGRTFSETGHTVSGFFLDYWEEHGGLAQQGFPISDVLLEVSDLDRRPYLVQYFERAVFECHPDYAGTPFVVLLSQLGTFRYQQQYPNGAPGQRPNGEHPYVFAQTGHTLGGEFRTYWEEHGGLAQQGYPLSEEFTEVSPLDGKPYTVQYFERAVFEFHPENQAPYRVLLSQLGTLRYRAKYPGPSLTPTPPAPNPLAPHLLGHVRPGGLADWPNLGGTSSAGNLVSGGAYVFWLDADSPWGDPALLGYDAAAGRTFVVSAAPGYKDGLVTDGHTVVWREVPGPGQAFPARLHAYNVATGQEWPAFAYPDLHRPLTYAVDGDTLYYIAGTGATEIDARHLATGQTTRFTTAALNAGFDFVTAGDGWVAWGASSTDVTTRLYRAPAGNPAAAAEFAVNPSGRISCVLAGGYVLWVEDPHWPGGARLHITTLSTGATQAVPWAGRGQLSAAGPFVAWNVEQPAGQGVEAVVLDLRSGEQAIYGLPSGGEYRDYAAVVVPGALAYVTGDSTAELYVQPLR